MTRLRSLMLTASLIAATTMPTFGSWSTASAAGPGCTVVALSTEQTGGPLMSYSAGASACLSVSKKLCVRMQSATTGTVISGPTCTGYSTSSSRNTNTVSNVGCSVGLTYRAYAWTELSGSTTKYDTDFSPTITCSASFARV